MNGLLSEHDLSQRELSAEINVAHSTISRIISGIDEAVEYLKSRIANMGKYEKEIDRWQA